MTIYLTSVDDSPYDYVANKIKQVIAENEGGYSCPGTYIINLQTEFEDEPENVVMEWLCDDDKCRWEYDWIEGSFVNVYGYLPIEEVEVPQNIDNLTPTYNFKTGHRVWENE